MALVQSNLEISLNVRDPLDVKLGSKKLGIYYFLDSTLRWWDYVTNAVQLELALTQLNMWNDDPEFPLAEKVIQTDGIFKIYDPDPAASLPFTLAGVVGSQTVVLGTITYYPSGLAIPGAGNPGIKAYQPFMRGASGARTNIVGTVTATADPVNSSSNLLANNTLLTKANYALLVLAVKAFSLKPLIQYSLL